MSNILLLFDVDGTLTKPRLAIEQNMIDQLCTWKDSKKVDLGIVGGSDIGKQREQLQDSIDTFFQYVFSENGMVAYQNNQLFHEMSIVRHFGESRFQQIINCCLQYLSTVNLPVKRGTFIEIRKGMINVSPIGRSCSQEERNAFFEYDKIHHVRKKMKEYLEQMLNDFHLNISIGGQISMDIFPQGWDKTYCLQFIESRYDKIYFFGDKTDPGGNDFEIFQDSRTIGHRVESPDDTIQQVQNIIDQL